MEKIRIGIMGYGNLGKGAHLAAAQNPDMTVAGIFTRRDPSAVAPVLPAPVYAEREAERLRGDIDVLLLCGGSATDLPSRGRAMRRCSTRWTASIRTRIFPRTSRRWTRRRRPAATPR